MKILLSELRQIIAEAFTEHQFGIMKSMLRSCLQATEQFTRLVTHDEGDKNAVLSALASGAKETRGWAPAFGRHYPDKANAAKRVHAIMDELDKMSVKPFTGLFGGKGKTGTKAAALYKELAQICEENFDTKEYIENYQDTDGRSFSQGDKDNYQYYVG